MTNNWMTVKVKLTRQMDDGTFKRVSEQYLFASMNFSDAEQRTYEELGAFVRGEFIVSGITRTDVHDIFDYEDSDVWYKCTIKFSSEAEEGSKSKKVSQTMLVSAHSVKEANARLIESLNGMMIDYEITGVVVSPIVEIFPFADNSLATDFQKQVEREVAEGMMAMGAKSVFSASGFDEDDIAG